ncbi:MAG TPA: hypothetical protein VFS34_11555, partial [Thermoanaerobaculia bacterium]|nr:hypothetical protein [Thermoanaerobaculia bacterium]
MTATRPWKVPINFVLTLCTAFLLTASTAFAVGTADVAVTKSNDTGGTAVAGQTVTYTITLHNFGPNGATQIHISDSMDVHLINIVANATVPDNCTITNQDILCDIQGIGNNGDDTIIITAQVDPATPATTVIQNCATITGANQTD